MCTVKGTSCSRWSAAAHPTKGRQVGRLVAANSLRMSGVAPFRDKTRINASTPRRVAAALCCVTALALSAASPPADASVGEIEQAVEWQRLVDLWHALIDHSSNLVYSPSRLRELVKDLNAVDGELSSLSESGLLRAEISDGLRWVFHTRYQYLHERHYANQAHIAITEAEAARNAAHWVIELQLSLLRRVGAGESREKLVEAATANIAYELTFLHHSDKFEAEVDRRGSELRKQEEAGETVDWDRFRFDCQRRRNALLKAYRNRKLPRVRAVEALLPCVIALTDGQRSTRPAAELPAGAD